MGSLSYQSFQNANDDSLMDTNDELWIINVGGYGSFVFRGCEKDAEEMRTHKAQWEQGVGSKWRVEDALVTQPRRAYPEHVLQRAKVTISALVSAILYGNISGKSDLGANDEHEK